MGCSGATARVPETQFIDLRLLDTSIPEYDNLFRRADESLRTIMNLNRGLRRGIADFVRLTSQELLKEHQFVDSMMVMLYCLSASAQGHIGSLGLEIENQPPFFIVSNKLLRPEHHKIAEAWYDLVMVLADINDKEEDLMAGIMEMAYQSEEFPKDVEKAIKHLSMDPVSASTAYTNTYQNFVKIKRAPAVLAEASNLAAATILVIQEICGRLKEEKTLARINHIGLKAHQERVFSPEEIVLKYWPEKDRIIKPRVKINAE